MYIYRSSTPTKHSSVPSTHVLLLSNSVVPIVITIGRLDYIFTIFSGYRIGLMHAPGSLLNLRCHSLVPSSGVARAGTVTHSHVFFGARSMSQSNPLMFLPSSSWRYLFIVSDIWHIHPSVFRSASTEGFRDRKDAIGIWQHLITWYVHFCIAHRH